MEQGKLIDLRVQFSEREESGCCLKVSTALRLAAFQISCENRNQRGEDEHETHEQKHQHKKAIPMHDRFAIRFHRRIEVSEKWLRIAIYSLIFRVPNFAE